MKDVFIIMLSLIIILDLVFIICCIKNDRRNNDK